MGKRRHPTMSMVGGASALQRLVVDILLQRRSRAGSGREASPLRRAAELIDFVGLVSSLDADVHHPVLRRRSAAGNRPRAGWRSQRVILLDEPAARLTAAEVKRLSTLIRTIAANGVFGAFGSNDDMQTLPPAAERALVLNFGRKIGEGNARRDCRQCGRRRSSISAVPSISSAKGGAHIRLDLQGCSLQRRDQESAQGLRISSPSRSSAMTPVLQTALNSSRPPPPPPPPPPAAQAAGGGGRDTRLLAMVIVLALIWLCANALTGGVFLSPAISSTCRSRCPSLPSWRQA